MPVHGTVTQDPSGVCTVARLVELLGECDPACPVMVAFGEDVDGGPKLGSVAAVTLLRDPIAGGEAALIVPHGALGPDYMEMLTRQAAVEESGEPS